MNGNKDEIYNFEKRLLQDRMQLQHLIYDQDIHDSEMMEHKLQNFHQEIEYMQRQLEYLKSGIEERNVQVMRTDQADMQPAGIRKNESAVNGKETEKIRITETKEPQKAEQKAEDAAPQTALQRDLEKIVGKSLMGIVASVLIFISLILFATLLLPYFNDTVKMVIMYLLSFAFLCAGLVRLRKDRENKFYVALTGCGVGAVYISLLLGNIYFKVIGDILLYVFIGIWSMGVCFLSRLKNKVFQVIGQLGIVIAMAFGCFLCSENEDAAKFLALVIFYMLSSGVLYYTHYSREFSDNLMQHVFNVINFRMLYITGVEVVGKGIHIISFLILAIFAVNIVIAMKARLERTGISFGFVISIYVFLTTRLLQCMILQNRVYVLTVYVLCMVLAVWTEWKTVKQKEGKYIAETVLIFLAAESLGIIGDWYKHGIIILIVLPCLFIGFYRANNVFKYVGMLFFANYRFAADAGNVRAAEQFLQGGIAAFAAYWLIYKKREQYSVLFKNVVHILTVLFLCAASEFLILEFTANVDASNVISFVLAAVFNIVMLKSCFGRNLKTGEKEKNTSYYAVNLLFMVAGLWRISRGNVIILHMLMIFITLVTFMVNSKNILDKRTGIGGIYVGIKFTVLMVVILNSFDVVNYVVSVACLILAIISIVGGFKGQYKSLRIFGLILSMLSTFKLIMVDISYANTLGNALSFFASGILCFMLSLIYNYIDRKFVKTLPEQG